MPRQLLAPCRLIALSVHPKYLYAWLFPQVVAWFLLLFPSICSHRLHPTKSLQDIHFRWLPCDLETYNNHHFRPSLTKIDLHQLYLTNSTHTQRFPSDIPSPEHLNPRLASRIPNGSRFTATIPSHDLKSFVTDYQKKWLTQHQTSRLPAYPPHLLFDQQIDFPLFPTPTDHRQARRHTGRTPVAFPVNIPNLDSVDTVHGHPQQDQIQNAAYQTAVSVSPVQNPQTSRIAHDTESRASPTSSSVSPLNSLDQRPHFYASSAPSSFVNLRPDNRQRTRPPVPPFPNSTGNVNVQMLSDSPQTSSEGKSASSTPLAVSPLTCSDPDLPSGMPSDLFDYPSNYDGVNPSFSSMIPFNNMDEYDLDTTTNSFRAINQRTSGSISTSVQTVSPKDLMLDTSSAPPSTSVTSLATPGTNYIESPSYEIDSFDTSPLFANDNLGPDADHWASLFPDHTGCEVEIVGQESPAVDQLVAPPMSRYGSSGQLSSKSSHHATHATSNGVAAKRRDKPLPAITIDDPTDIVAVKRARNTMAARKSRQRRMERTDELQKLVTDLEKQVDRWKGIALSCGYVEHSNLPTP